MTCEQETILGRILFIGMVILLLINARSYAVAGELPDLKLTPGAINPDVTQENIHQTICIRGYAESTLPPASYTNRIKKRQMRLYYYADHNPRNYKEDHLISLSIGGNPTDPKNLWPEPRYGKWNAEKKVLLEKKLHDLICHGKLPLATAQKEIATNWIRAYKKYIGR